MEHINRSRFGTTWCEDLFDGKKAFKNMQSMFEEAMARHPDALYESFYVFGGHHVRIRVIGRTLAEHICRPFLHLQAYEPYPPRPQLTIDLWDENETGISDQVKSIGNDPKWTERTVKTRDERFIGQQLPHTLSCLDRETGRIVGSIAWHDRIFIYERAKPLARLLLEWHNSQGIQIIHTGLVARDGQGVLFAGKSGSGKSTSSLVCLCAGFQFLSEDYVGLQQLQDGSFVGHSLYNSVFLQTSHLARFPELLPHAIKGKPPQEEKSVVIFSQVIPERLERVVPIRVLVLPRVVDASEPQIRPASKSEALFALGPSSLLQIPNRGLGMRGLSKLAELAERVPSYWLDLGRDGGSIPQCVEEILGKVT